MNHDNPAARLLALLERARTISKGVNCEDAWETLLDAKANKPLLMARLGKVMELPQQTLNAFSDSFPNHSNTTSHWMIQVNAAFTHQNLKGTWESFRSHIDTHTILYLTMTSQLLETKSNTTLIADESLLELRDRLNELLVEILDSDQPVELKKYVSRVLRKLIESIDEYKLTGALPVLDSIEMTFGHVCVDKQFHSFLTDHDLGKRIADTLTAVANTVTVAVGIPQLSQTILALGM